MSPFSPFPPLLILLYPTAEERPWVLSANYLLWNLNEIPGRCKTNEQRVRLLILIQCFQDSNPRGRPAGILIRGGSTLISNQTWRAWWLAPPSWQGINTGKGVRAVGPKLFGGRLSYFLAFTPKNYRNLVYFRNWHILNSLTRFEILQKH